MRFPWRMRILIPAQYPKAVGVQVRGTLLNKNVLTGDDYWSVRWQQIPESLRCYALGDIMFGFVSYNVLSGLLLRDVLPNPDVLCRFLKCNQKTAADWFLDFILMSPEGVEFHQAVKEGAETWMRSKRMVWLNRLSSDWEYEERTRWKDEIPALGILKKRSGVMREKNPRSGKLKRMRMRSLMEGAAGSTAKEPAGIPPSQPSPGLSGARNGFRVSVSGPQQEDSYEDDEVFLEDEGEKEEKVPLPWSS